MLRVASPANPFGSSAEFTGGYKEFDAVMPFSIGDTGIELMTLNPAATSLNVSIKGSIATFDYPQTSSVLCPERCRLQNAI